MLRTAAITGVPVLCTCSSWAHLWTILAPTAVRCIQDEIVKTLLAASHSPYEKPLRLPTESGVGLGVRRRELRRLERCDSCGGLQRECAGAGLMSDECESVML